MNISDFKERIKSLQTSNAAVKRVNIISPNTSRLGLDSIKTSHKLIFTSNPTTSRTSALTPILTEKLLKTLNWRNVSADYYIWFDTDIKLIDPGAVDWMINNLSHNDSQLVIFDNPKRSSIEEEGNYLTSNLLSGDEDVISQITEYKDDITFYDDRLYLTSAFIFKKELIENKHFNLMLDWFLEISSRSTADQISLPYLLHKHNVSMHTFQESITENNYIRRYSDIEELFNHETITDILN